MSAESDGPLPQGFIDRLEPLTALVLYRTPRRWQYAILAGGGILDGHLHDVPLSAEEGDAQAALLELIERWTGKTVDATWRATEPDWWAADASYLT